MYPKRGFVPISHLSGDMLRCLLRTFQQHGIDHKKPSKFETHHISSTNQNYQIRKERSLQGAVCVFLFVPHRWRCHSCRCAVRHGWACRSRSACRTSAASLSGPSGTQRHYLVNIKHMALRRTALWQSARCQELPEPSWTCEEQTGLRADFFIPGSLYSLKF